MFQIVATWLVFGTEEYLEGKHSLVNFSVKLTSTYLPDGAIESEIDNKDCVDDFGEKSMSPRTAASAILSALPNAQNLVL